MTSRVSPATIRVLHALALLCTGVVFGLTLSHVLQAPGSRGLGGAEWLDVMHTFYGGFAIVGGITEILGVLTAAAVAAVMFTRHMMATAVAMTIASLSMLGTLVAYWVGNRPVNALVTNWTSSTLPSDWGAYRDTWETAHAVSSALRGIAFIIIALVLLSTAYRDKHEPATTSPRRR